MNTILHIFAVNKKNIIMATLNIGDKVIIKGRFQSREYTKNDAIKTAFEISVSSILKVEEEK